MLDRDPQAQPRGRACYRQALSKQTQKARRMHPYLHLPARQTAWHWFSAQAPVKVDAIVRGRVWPPPCKWPEERHENEDDGSLPPLQSATGSTMLG